jgi:hypothetical protein
MAYSSIMGADTAPSQPDGRDSKALGPSDNSDSGSDTISTPEAHADSDAVGTGERAAVNPDVEGREGGDILPDHVVELPPNDQAQEQTLSSPRDIDELTDLDANDIEGGGDQESERT